MLSPLGSLVIKFDNQNFISGTESSLECEDEDDIQDATLHAPSPSVCENEEELDLEDLIGKTDTEGLEEATTSDLSAYLTIEVKDGTKKRVHKARALKVLFQEIIHEKGSTDWQKCIQGLARYSDKPACTSDSPEISDSIFGESICVGDTAVTLLVIEQMVCLAVIHVSSLKLGAADIQQAPISILPEDNIMVGFHILTLKSPCVHNLGNSAWTLANRALNRMAGKVKGKYIQPISPTVSVDERAKHTTFIFQKTKLQELT